ncbi:dienelactone hydrolase family protein [Anthocerotibacter panamensis]|uniref:dienelactone hydrolase family protein n=1 Tax=Anthocerotibacter panamensis TaxID=2857077 RepID=UPI001C40356E|nr:dienelactone hydrolase family protein [Anthocerotibacter panamensis]
MEITTQSVTLPVADQSMGSYLAQPITPGSYPGVLVLMEIFGVNSHIRSVTERLAQQGYVALAIDYYHRTAPGMELGYTQPDVEQGFAQAQKTTAADLIADLEAGIQYLQTQPQVRADRIGTIGFCFGGHVAYLAATLPQVRATVSYYGGGIAQYAPGGGPPTLTKTPQIQGAVLCFFGNQDSSIPPAQNQAIEAALQEHHIDHQVYRYEAGHGFFCDQRGSYDPQAAAASWEQAKTFLHDKLAL